MKLTTTLGRGLAAIGTIGALSLGSLLIAPGAHAAGLDSGVIPTTPGATVTVDAIFQVPSNVAPKNALIQFTVAGDATFTSTNSVGHGIRTSGTTEAFKTGQLSAGSCTNALANTRKSCRINVNSWTGDVYTLKPGFDYRWGAALQIPANAQPGDLYTVTTTFNGMTSTVAYEIPTVVAGVVVTSPSTGSTIPPQGAYFEGTAEPGETVVITDADGNIVGSALVNDQGKWTATHVGPLAEGTVDLTFTAGYTSTTESYLVLAEEDGEGVPAIDPLYAGLGLGAALLVGLGVYGIRRRVADDA